MKYYNIGKVYARRIHDGEISLANVPKLYRAATIQAYYDLYGEELEG